MDRRNGPLYPYDIRAKLAPPQYGLLVAIGEQLDVGLSEALRHVLQAVLESEVDEVVPQELRDVVRTAAAVQADPHWAERNLV